jgi:hypothetical protein
VIDEERIVGSTNRLLAWAIFPKFTDSATGGYLTISVAIHFQRRDEVPHGHSVYFPR